MTIETFVVNPFAENTYVVSDSSGECIVIDPGCYSPQERRVIEDYIHEKGLRPVMAVCTHAHIDHIIGVEWITSHYGIPLALHQADNFMIESAAMQGSICGFQVGEVPAPTVALADGGDIHFGDTTLKVIHTPGHTPGHVCLYDEVGKRLFTGDTLFRESIGRTDLPGGDYSWIMRSILDKILTLGGDVAFYCGHGQSSTIGHEMLYNPFITEVLNGEVSPGRS